MTVSIPPEIVVWATNKAFLNIYDCLDIERVKFEVASYDRNTRRQTARAVAYVHVNKVRAAFQAVMDGSFPSAWFGKQEKGEPVLGIFEAFGGGEQDGQTISRIFRLEVDPGDRRQFALKPYRITVVNGPGVRTRTGGIAPAKGGQATRVSMRFSVAEMREIAAAVLEYITAYTVTHFSEIRAARIAETAQKMEERQQQAQSPRPQPPQEGRNGRTRRRSGNGRPRTPVYLPFEPKDPDLKRYKNRPLAELLQAGEKGIQLLRWLVQNRPDTPLGQEASYLLLQQRQAN